MARAYGRFTTSIWLDPDFTSLTLTQQAMYFSLGLQADVSAAGVLPYTSRRWAKLSAETKRDDIERMVAELEASPGRHLIVDEDTEEVFIRKFMKWDMGWANTQKRLRVVLDAVDAVSSMPIRAAAVVELWSIARSEFGTPNSRDALSRELKIRYLDPANTVSGSDRVVVKKRDYDDPNPLTATLEREPPQPASPIPLGAAEPPSMFCSKHPDGTEEPCGPCATARTRYAQHVQDTAGREAEAKASRAVAIVACPDCDDRGMQLDPETRKPTGRCSHPTLDRPTGTP